MTPTKQPSAGSFLSAFKTFQQSLNGQAGGALGRQREEAIHQFETLGIPTLRHEEWKYTSVARLGEIPFAPSPEHPTGISAGALEPFSFPGLNGSRLVFLNGRFAPEHSVLTALPQGVLAGSLAEVLRTGPSEVEDFFGKYAKQEASPFNALNTAFWLDGFYLNLPRNTVVEEPFHVLYVATNEYGPFMAHPRNLFVVGPNSQAVIVEQYVTLGSPVSFTNAVTEVVLADGAILDHYKLQQESIYGFHIATIQVQQDANSRFTNHQISLGGTLSRNDINTVLDGPGAEGILNGLFLAHSEQHMDTHSLIDHAKPHCTSHELYKGILDDRSRGVFNGKVMVRPDAQKTNAYQQNNNLLLSREAHVDTKPQLEIFADDVKCSHGATVGQLEGEPLFYLRSRGIPLEDARRILVHAFASDMVQYMTLEPVKEALERYLDERLAPTH